VKHIRNFQWVLERLAQASLIKSKTMGDSTTLEANAAMSHRSPRHGRELPGVLETARRSRRIEAKDAAACSAWTAAQEEDVQ